MYISIFLYCCLHCPSDIPSHLEFVSISMIEVIELVQKSVEYVGNKCSLNSVQLQMTVTYLVVQCRILLCRFKNKFLIFCLVIVFFDLLYTLLYCFFLTCVLWYHCVRLTANSYVVFIQTHHVWYFQQHIAYMTRDVYIVLLLHTLHHISSSFSVFVCRCQPHVLLNSISCHEWLLQQLSMCIFSLLVVFFAIIT